MRFASLHPVYGETQSQILRNGNLSRETFEVDTEYMNFEQIVGKSITYKVVDFCTQFLL